MTWTNEDLEFFKSNLSGKVPHFSVSRSTLGGEATASVMMLLCFDAKETWSNGIMENSRYMRIHVVHSGKQEHFGGSCGIKMRGFTSLDRSKVLAKILAHIAKVKELLDAFPNIDKY